jgi:hypothetical protein
LWHDKAVVAGSPIQLALPLATTCDACSKTRLRSASAIRRFLIVERPGDAKPITFSYSPRLAHLKRLKKSVSVPLLPTPDIGFATARPD